MNPEPLPSTNELTQLVVSAHIYALKRAALILSQLSGKHSPDEVLRDLLMLGFHESTEATPEQMEADLQAVLKLFDES